MPLSWVPLKKTKACRCLCLRMGWACLFNRAGGRALSFHDLSAGEAPAPLPKEGENGGGGKFPSQISHRKDQPGSPWNERKDTNGPLLQIWLPPKACLGGFIQ